MPAAALLTVRALSSSPSTASTIRATPATRLRPHSSPMACIWLGARSSITGRAKYLSAGAEEPNALVTVARGPGRVTPNLRATQIELFDGLRASSQNRWPSLAFDLGAVNDLLSPLFGAGFYYKTFMGPELAKNWAWARVYEPLIRRAAGLGAPPREPDPDRYTRTFDHCDVLIIGAGPAGLARGARRKPKRRAGRPL